MCHAAPTHFPLLGALSPSSPCSTTVKTNAGTKMSIGPWRWRSGSTRGLINGVSHITTTTTIEATTTNTAATTTATAEHNASIFRLAITNEFH